MQDCPCCAAQNPDSAKFCVACGNALWATFWRQWTPEQRRKIGEHAAFRQAAAAQDLFAAQSIAIDVIYPAPPPGAPRDVIDPRQLWLNL